MDTSGNTRQGSDSRPGGILRVDINKPRRSSGSSVEFRHPPELLGLELNEGIGPSSPQPSIDRLSVTWADSEAGLPRLSPFTPGTPPATKMEVRFPDGEASEDEDYSASVSAIMQRRVSTRRSRRGAGRGRRPSSPFSPDPTTPAGARRRSSAFTTSSGETAISIEDGQDVTQEQIYENIRLHKEVLGSVKQQPWGMRRKLRLVNQAKAYIKKHEGALQERLAQNKCTRDILARFNILLARRLQRMKREAANLSNWLIPWELRIKEIESHFGSVVASYFTFLRWLFWVNFVISVVLIVFVVVPEILTADTDAGERKEMLPEERQNSSNLRTLWEFEGILKYSPIFYGYYNIRKPDKKGGYHLPLAYLMTGIAVYIYSFVATLRKMAENSRMSKLSEKEDECIFSWKLFTGWDYMIGNSETAHNKTASIVLGFKEALLEEAEKKRDLRNWKIIIKRVFVNACTMFLLCVSAYAVVEVVGRSRGPEAESNLWRQNEITIVMSLISFIFPIFFELLGLLESYHPRRQLRIQLARIMLLNLLNLYSLIFALFDKITDMTEELRDLKPNLTTIMPPLSSATSAPQITFSMTDLTTDFSTLGSSSAQWDVTEFYDPENVTHCYEVEVTCPTTTKVTLKNITTTLLTIIFANSTSLTPIIPYDQTTESSSLAYNTSDFLESSTQNLNDSVIFTDISHTSNSFVSQYDTQTPTSNFYSTLSDNLTLAYDQNETDYNNYYEIAEQEFDNSFLQDDPFAFENFSQNINYSEIKRVIDYTTPILEIDIPPLNEKINSFQSDAVTSDRSENLMWDENSEIQNQIQTTDNIQDDSLFENTDAPDNKPCFITKCITVSRTGDAERRQFLTSKTTDDNVESEMMPSFSALIDKQYHFEKASSTELNITTRKRLRNLCWETMFGQELVKLTMMDLVLTILATLFVDFFRAVFVRFMNRCWCWDLEKTFPQYGDFKIAENILHLVNNQGMVWMGMFFSPGLVVLNIVKLVILMYLRSWAVMTCNVPHEVVFRASRSNNFYLALLLTMLFLCVLPVGYAIVWVEPSWHCGPFSNYQRIYHLFTQTLHNLLSKRFHKALDYIASPGIVIPLLVLLILIIYYLLSLTGALREANNDLKIQLRRARTEERRKMFQIADRRNRGGSNELESTPFAKWKKILPVMPSNKIEENGDISPNINDKTDAEKKDSLSKIVKMALRKSSGTSDDESCLAVPPADDETDTEFHESLPEDVLMAKDIHFCHKKKQNNLNKSEIEYSDEKVNFKKKSRQKQKHANTESHGDKKNISEKRNYKAHKFSLDSDKFIPQNQENMNHRSQKDSKIQSFSTIQEFHINFPEQNSDEYKNIQPPHLISTSGDKNANQRKWHVGSQGKENSVNKETFELKNVPKERFPCKSRSLSMSLEKQEDSITSVIPVITISKTESDEDVLDDSGKKKHNKIEEKVQNNPKNQKKNISKSDDQLEENTVASPKTLQKNVVDISFETDHGKESNIFFTDDFKQKPSCSKALEGKRSKYKNDLVRSLLNAAKDFRHEEKQQKKNDDAEEHGTA